MNGDDRLSTGSTSTQAEDFLSMLESEADWLACSKRVRRGLPAYFIVELSALIGISTHELVRLLKLKASSHRRWAKCGSLNSKESDYIFRVAVVANLALKFFEGDKSALRDWLSHPAPALGQKMPIELLTTFVGLGMIEALVWKLEHGVVT